MKTGMLIEDKHYTWKEIYKLCGCVQEDFLYDSTSSCYNDLLKAIKEKEQSK